MNTLLKFVLTSLLLFWLSTGCLASAFVRVRGTRMYIGSKPYHFVGANYWYGPLIALEKKKRRGIERLRRELDFLKAHGVTNLRLLGGAEGSGLLNGVMRVGPPLQPEMGKFDLGVLKGLDIVLVEMAKRDMKAVIFLSNNWEWSGGFQQYLIWNGVVSKDLLTRKPSWDELRDIDAKFYSCDPCKKDYERQLRIIISRRNSITGKRYVNDPTIMAWELANEPRPMRPAANDDYKAWIKATATLIKRMDRNHLVTIGHEGSIGTESMKLFEEVHSYPQIDYATIHIWAKNWGWVSGNDLAGGFDNATQKARNYIEEHITVARQIKKPIVIEEFGLPRDNIAFSPDSPTTFRDRYFRTILTYVRSSDGDVVAGANFWAFGGTARPRPGQTFWKPGDDYMGDPSMEEQGLNSVFDADTTTWAVIARESKRITGDSPIKK